MKQKSEYNTLVGAIVGALPPFIGTFAQTGALLDVPTLILAGYIFSWQFPHFYGILYENKDDYQKAGFVMISDEDPTGDKKAYNQMLYCNTLNTFLPFAMAMPSVGMIHPVVLAPYLLFQMRTFVALRQFKKENGSTNSAKQVKRTAYYPFVILLLGFFGTTAWKRFEERRLRDEELYGIRV
jgi:protoheme IX farnesyltransferase